jgi:hypothetical protein
VTAFERRKDELSAEDRRLLRRQANDFARAWLEGPDAPPKIDDYIAAVPEGSPLRVLLLVDLVKTEVESRRALCENVQVEQYLAHYAELGLDAEARSQLLRWESDLLGQATVARNGVSAPQRDDTFRDPIKAKVTPAPEVPGFEVLEEMGRGGMGVVYRARHVKLNRVVAWFAAC